MKRNYESLKISIRKLDLRDIVRTSNGEDDLPVDWD